MKTKVRWLFSCVLFFAFSLADAQAGNAEKAIRFESYYSIELKGITNNFVGLFFQQYPGFDPKAEVERGSTLPFYREGMTADELKRELEMLKAQFKHGYAVGIGQEEDIVTLRINFEYIDAFEQRGFLFEKEKSGLVVTPIDYKEYKKGHPDDGYVIKEAPVPMAE